MSQLILHEEGKAKFVLLIPRSKDEEFLLKLGNGEFNDYFIVSNPTASLHREIIVGFEKEKKELFICLGGGYIRVSDTEILAFGTSKDYQTANRKIVSKILMEHVTTKIVKVEMDVDYD
jgi:hypothetical protein